MNRITIKKTIVGVAITLLSITGFELNGLAATLTLPDPTKNYGTTLYNLTGHEYTAWAHDDFWSFAAPLITTAQDTGLIPKTYGNYAAATGTGGLDIILYTGSKGAQNNKVGPSEQFAFQNPIINSGGGTESFQGTWGDNAMSSGGPVKVDALLDYLHSYNPLNNIPVFMMDLNNKATLGFVGRVYLTDAFGNKIAQWDFDDNPQPTDSVDPNRKTADVDYPGFSQMGDWNPDAPATAVVFNGGSGKVDYLAYAPTMDLSKYSGHDYNFVTEFWLGTASDPLNGGFEEIYLTGRVNLPGSPVPEPGTLVLLGAGLLGLAIYGKRRLNK